MVFFSKETAPQILILTIIFMTAGCAANTEPPPKELQSGFHKEDIPPVYVQTLHAEDGIILAGTEANGVYKKELHSSGPWISIGLDKLSVRDIVIWNSQEFLAAVNYEKYDADHPDQFLTMNGGDSWQALYTNYMGKRGRIEAGPGQIEKSATAPLKLHGDCAARSTDRGKTWFEVDIKVSNGLCYGYFLRVSRLHPGVIWAGGSTAFYQAYLYKSVDNGKSWKRYELKKKSDAGANDIIIHFSNSNVLFVILGGLCQWCI